MDGSTCTDIPVNTVSLPCWWWPVVKDMPQMSVTGSAQHLGPGHEYDGHIKLGLDAVANGLIIGRPSSTTVKLGR